MPTTTSPPRGRGSTNPAGSAATQAKMQKSDPDPELSVSDSPSASGRAAGPSPAASQAAGKRGSSPPESASDGAGGKKGAGGDKSASSSPPPRLGSACSFSSADTAEGLEGTCKGCDNPHCTRHGAAGESEDEETWGGWSKDRVVKPSNGMYKAWYPRVESQLVTLSSSEISCDLTAIHYPGTFHVGQRVLVEYDDGITYPGAIVSLGARNKWRIRLDEGTTFMTTLPDPDVQVLEEDPRTSKAGHRSSSDSGPTRSKRARTSTWARRE